MASVGWYEAGWGPMMSETAFFVKDVVGPKGSVSIVMAETAGPIRSDDIAGHTKTNQILWHHADSRPDERIDLTDEPDHDALCEREQRYLLTAIEEDSRSFGAYAGRRHEPAYRARRRPFDPGGAGGPAVRATGGL